MPGQGRIQPAGYIQRVRCVYASPRPAEPVISDRAEYRAPLLFMTLNIENGPYSRVFMSRFIPEIWETDKVSKPYSGAFKERDYASGRAARGYPPTRIIMHRTGVRVTQRDSSTETVVYVKAYMQAVKQALEQAKRSSVAVCE